MRFIDRTDVKTPKVFFSQKVSQFNGEIQTYLESDSFKRAPKPNEDILRDKDFRESLRELFNSKCAYCETKLDKEEEYLDHFRPIGGAERFNGKVDSKHYSWLALEWGNINLACKNCIIHKRNLFPVKTTGKLGVSLDALRVKEKAFLLDPCYDSPEKHLWITLDGKLYPLTQRGKITIDILNLNRKELIYKRKDALEICINLWKALFNEKHKIVYIADEFLKLIHKKQEFSGIIYLLLRQLSRHNKNINFFAKDRTKIYNLFLDYNNSGYKSLSQIVDNIDQNTNFTYNTIHKSYYLQKVTIKNFKGIRNCVLEFNNENDSFISSKTLIGKNAVGKTTILQAIVLGILGTKNIHNISISPNDCLRKNANEGFIEVSFVGSEEKNILKFKRDTDIFSGHTKVDALILGYGAYRLPAKRMLSQDKRDQNVRVHSLFNERQLINGPHGLLKKYNKRLIDDIGAAIEELLTDDGIKIKFPKKMLHLYHKGAYYKLENFSSGYQSIISFVTDIIDVLLSRTKSIEAAQGIVLVDEIDAHLHPEWRMRIVKSLREVFPKVQFIFTTHDPLVLRGLKSKEVILLNKDENEDIDTQRYAPKFMSELNIDQLLTSVFGLHNTVSSEIEHLFNEYYHLLSLNSGQLLPDDITQLEFLENKLQSLDVYGNTKRERLLFKVIDKVLAADSRTDNTSFDEWDKDDSEKMVNDILLKMDLV